MAETTTSQNEHLRIMPTAEGQAATSQAVFLSTRPTIPKSGFYRDGTMSPYARRKIRMQEDWDKQRAAQIEEARVFQQMELQRKQFEIQSRDQQLQEDQFYFDREAAVAEQKLKAQQTAEAREFLSAVNSLDPRSSDYRDNLIQLRRQYPLGSLDETVAAVVGDYDKVHSVYMDSEKERKEEAKLAEGSRNEQLAKLTKLAIQTNRNLSQLVQSDIKTGELIVDPIAVGEAEAELATKPVADPNAPTYRREGAKLREQLRQLDSKIIANKLDAQNAKKETLRSEFEQNAAVLEAQRNLLYSEYVGVQELLKESGAAPTPTSEAEEPAAPKPTEDQIAMARRAIAEQPEDSTLHRLSRQFLERNGIPLTEQPAQPSTQTTTPTQQPEATVPTQTTTTTSPTQGSVPQARAELAQQELVAQRAREEAGLMNQPPVIRDINQAFSSQYSGVREKVGAAKATRRRVDPFKGRDTKDAQTIQLALDLVYPPMEGGGFDVGDSTDPAVVSAAEFLSKVSPSLLRMIAASPASNRSRLSLEEIKQIAAKGKRLPRGSKKTS